MVTKSPLVHRREDSGILFKGDADEDAGTTLVAHSLPSCSEDSTTLEKGMRSKPRRLRGDLTENGPRRTVIKRKV